MDDSQAIRNELIQTEANITKLCGETTEYFEANSASLREVSDLHKEQTLELLKQVQCSSDAFSQIIEGLKGVKADILDLEMLATRTGKLRLMCETLATKHEIDMK